MSTNNSWNTPDLTADGQLVIGDTAGRPKAATITAGSNMTVTNAAGSITLASTASGGGSLVFLGKGTASASASIDFTSLISSTYSNYLILWNNVQPGTSIKDLLLRVSTDNGSSFSSASYDCRIATNNTGAWSDDSWGTYGTGFRLSENSRNATNDRQNGYAILSNFPVSAYSFIQGHGTGQDGGVSRNFFFRGTWESTTAVDAVQFIFESGTITTGTFLLYGFAES